MFQFVTVVARIAREYLSGVLCLKREPELVLPGETCHEGLRIERLEARVAPGIIWGD